MSSFTVLVLICTLSTPPSSCDEGSAIDIIASRAGSELGCAVNWQATIAGTGLREGLGESVYMKTVCTRRHVVSALRENRR